MRKNLKKKSGLSRHPQKATELFEKKSLAVEFLDKNQKKDNILREKVLMSEFVRIAREQKISFEKIIECLKKNFNVHLVEVDNVKVIFIEEKEKKSAK